MDLQRHDYINHLQVISGLLELGRPERASEYLKETLRIIETERMLLKRQDKGLGLFLYCLWQKLRASQLEVRFAQIEEESNERTDAVNPVDSLDSIVEGIAEAFSGKVIDISVAANPRFIFLLVGDSVRELRFTYYRGVCRVC